MKTHKSNQLHFNEECHKIENCSISPIEEIVIAGGSERDMNRMRLQREKYWIEVLQTVYPFGLNERLAGVGDFRPSQVNLRFNGRTRRPRSHGHRKPRRLRPYNHLSLEQLSYKHANLRGHPSYMHFIKTYLYGLPRIKINHLLEESARLDQEDVRLMGAIKMITNIRLFRPVSIHASDKRKIEYHFRFIDKGLDYINISGILRSESVCSKITSYFNKAVKATIATAGIGWYWLIHSEA